MIALEILRRLYRFYNSWYRIGHDRSLAASRSVWSLEVALQPATPLEGRALKGLLGREGWTGDEESLLFKSPLSSVLAAPRLDRILSLPTDCSGLKGTKVQVQLLLAPDDRDFREDFQREEGWMWLLSSGRLTELFMIGVLSDERLDVRHFFHSCYRSDQNREVTEELQAAVQAWDRAYAEVSRPAGPGRGPEAEPDGALVARKAPLAPSRWERYRFLCEDQSEAARLVYMFRDLGLERIREVKAAGSTLESCLEPLELADVVSYLHYGGGLGLFQA